MRLLLGLALLLASGCTSEPLAAEWLPLVRVEQDPTRLVGAGVVTTIEDTIFVRDLAAFDLDNPAGSTGLAALLTHEREHARRQAAAGPEWFVRYLAEPSFRWAEEQIGWRLEIEYHLAHGDLVDAENVANFLVANYMSMVDRPTALAWVQSVIAGR